MNNYDLTFILESCRQGNFHPLFLNYENYPIKQGNKTIYVFKINSSDCIIIDPSQLSRIDNIMFSSSQRSSKIIKEADRILKECSVLLEKTAKEQKERAERIEKLYRSTGKCIIS